jgi:hypothetical protein
LDVRSERAYPSKRLRRLRLRELPVKPLVPRWNKGSFDCGCASL